jgi:hypothetical protein
MKYLPKINFNPDFVLAEEKDYVDGVSMTFEITLLAEPKGAVKK